MQRDLEDIIRRRKLNKKVNFALKVQETKDFLNNRAKEVITGWSVYVFPFATLEFSTGYTVEEVATTRMGSFFSMIFVGPLMEKTRKIVGEAIGTREEYEGKKLVANLVSVGILQPPTYALLMGITAAVYGQSFSEYAYHLNSKIDVGLVAALGATFFYEHASKFFQKRFGLPDTFPRVEEVRKYSLENRVFIEEEGRGDFFL